MTSPNSAENPQNEQAENDLQRLRDVLVHPLLEDFKREQKNEQQDEVSQVISQALIQREREDSSVSAALNPLVQKTVKSALISQRKDFTDAMFPLVGDLVRKFVAAALRDFIEKTNQVIENSVSAKGLKWRLQAWRAGVPFPTYVISQTYVFRIEQVLLIHRETGILINSANVRKNDTQESELISAMLTAINDFVSDSFKKEEGRDEQELAEIKTDGFTLLVLKGPKALLVAAVNGNISPEAKIHLQSSLENIHSQYFSQLHDFSGNSEELIATSETLETCLISKQKGENTQSTYKDQVAAKHKKKPLFAVFLFTLIFASLAYWSFLHWETNRAIRDLERLPKSALFIPLHIEKEGIHDIHIRALSALSADERDTYLAQSAVSLAWLNVEEYPLDTAQKPDFQNTVTALLSAFPTLSYVSDSNSISGELQESEFDALLLALRSLGKLDNYSNSPRQLPTYSNIQLTPAQGLSDDEAKRHLLSALSAQIAQIQIDYPLAESRLEAEQEYKVEQIAKRFKSIQALNQDLGTTSYLLVIGSADSVGAQDVNISLSQARAESLVQALVDLDIEAGAIIRTGVMPVDTQGRSVSLRKAFVSVIHSQPNEN